MVFAQTLLVIMTVLNFLVMAIMVFMLHRNYKSGTDWCCWSGGGDEEYKKMQRDKKRCSLCRKLLMVPCSILCVMTSDAIRAFFADLAAKECSDPVTNEQILKLSEGIQSVYDKNVSALAMTLGIFVLEAALMIRAIRNNFKEANGGPKIKQGAPKKSGSYETHVQPM